MKLHPQSQVLTATAKAWRAHATWSKGIDIPGRVYRHFWPDSEMNDRIARMAVQDTVNDVLGAITPEVEWIDGPFNEVAQRQGAGLEQHADFMAAFVPAMKAARPGTKIAGFAFSTGNPGSLMFGDRDDFQYLYNRQWCGVDAVSLHCYWGPKGLLPDNALRYRALCSTVPSHPPILITECGRDGVDGGERGWKACGLSGYAYLKELATYALELDRDDDVLAAFPFVCGGTPDWGAYDLNGLDLGRFYTKFSDDTSKGVAMDQATLEAAVKQEAEQNTLLTEALRRIRQGKWTGADGVDGLIVALQGGKPLDFSPSFPNP